MSILIRQTSASDYEAIVELCSSVYPASPVWTREQILSHLKVFPEGQLVAEDQSTGKLVGMAASLIIRWDDYELGGSWRDFTGGGSFQNHDPANGRTLYGAEIMVHPHSQGSGIGKLLYVRRREIAERLGLLRIRAGARLRGYGTYAGQMKPDEYVIEVIRGKLFDPTLTFQLKQGFSVLSLVSGYLRHDPESLGYAAVIEWINDRVAKPEDYLKGEAKFRVSGPYSIPVRGKP